MKKILSLALAFMMFFSLSMPALASDTSVDIETMRYELQQKGIPSSFLERRSDIQIEKLYQDCLNHDIAFGGSEISYWKDGREVIQTRGAIPEYDMALDVSTLYDVGDDGKGNNTYEECWVYVYYEWTSGHPAIRKVDGITVNWDPTVWSYKGEFKHTDYSDKWTAYSGVTSPARRVQGGLGYYAYLDSSGKNLVGDTRFTLIPAKTPLYPEGSSKPHFTSEINVNYGHDKNPLTWVTGVSFSVEGVGVGLTLGDLTDEASDTYTGYYSWSK